MPCRYLSHGAMPMPGQRVGGYLHGYLLTIGPSCWPLSASCQVERVERGDFARRWRIEGGGRGGGGMPGTGAGGVSYR